MLVAGVPVPPSVHASGPVKQSLEDGPGFTTKKFHEVWRSYSTNLTCNQLESDWTAALREAGRRYAIVHHTPANFGYYQEVITLPAQGAHLAITLGDGQMHCASPAVEAYTNPS
jgi:hypothetical protein